MEEDALELPPPKPLLISLPPELLELVVFEVEDRDLLRLTCHALRLVVDALTTQLTWRGPPATIPRSLAGVLPVSCPSIHLLICSGLKRSLVSLVGCPSTTQVLL